MTTDKFRVETEQVPFVMVPQWVLEASASAVKLFAVLQHFANRKTGDAWPSRQTLADAMGYKQAKTLDPIIAELEGMGAMTVTRVKSGGRNAPNVYHMVMTKPKKGVAPENGLFPEDETMVRSSDENSPVQRQRIVPENGHELEPKNYNQEPEKPRGTDVPPEDSVKEASSIIAKRAFDGTKGAYPYMGAYKIAEWALNAAYLPQDVENAMGSLWKNGKPLTRVLVAQVLEGIVKPGQRPNRADQRRDESQKLIEWAAQQDRTRMEIEA